MEKIFIACPISKYIDGDQFIDDEFKIFIEELYSICQKYVPNVFLALKREKYGKNLMKDTCVTLDFEEIKNADLVIAIPEDSKGTAVELGWASSMSIQVLLLLDCNQRYTPLISGLNNITDTEIIWYDGNLNKDILSNIDRIIQEKYKE